MRFRCASAVPSGCPAGSHRRQLEGCARAWLPGGSNVAGFALAWLLRGQPSGCRTCLPLLPWCSAVLFPFGCFTPQSFRGMLFICRQRGPKEKEKSCLWPCPGWLVATASAVLVLCKISAGFLSTVSLSAEKVLQGVCSGIGNVFLWPLLDCWVATNILQNHRGEGDSIYAAVFSQIQTCLQDQNQKKSGTIILKTV